MFKKILVWIPSHLAAIAVGAGIIYLAVVVHDVATIGQDKTVIADLRAAFNSTSDSLAVAQDRNRQLASDLQDTQRQLADSGRTIDQQQSTIAGQQRLIDQGKQELIRFKQSLEQEGSDFGKRLSIIASSFDSLYQIYCGSQGCQ